MPPAQTRNFYDLEEKYRQATLRQQHALVQQQSSSKKQNLLTRSIHFLKSLSSHWIIIVLCFVGIILCLSITSIVFALIPRSLSYSFAKQSNCVISPELLTGTIKPYENGSFRIVSQPYISIGHTSIVSMKTCVYPISSPTAENMYKNQEHYSLLGLHLTKTLSVKTSNYIGIDELTNASTSIPIDSTIKFKLASADATFAYALAANDKENPCSKQQTTVVCQTAGLGLSYATHYSANLVRVFNNVPINNAALSTKIQTITATVISASSIGSGSTVYNKPQQIVLTTDKALTSLDGVSLSYKTSTGAITQIPVTTSFSGQTINVNFSSELPRSTAINLTVNNLKATDQSSLSQPYNLVFNTSGGPAVAANNMPSYGMASTQAVTLTFSQSLLSSQSLASNVSLLVNGAAQPANAVINGDNKITVTPTTSYPVCATVKVVVTGAIQSQYGVSGNSAYNYSSRSHCYTTFSIGTSVQGRPITAYKFGTGPSMVLYIGAMEGNEQNSSQLLQQWIPNVDANPGKIPSYRTLVIIPTINPDGYAADTRLNADGIDLNRNFPASNWQESVTEPTANTVWTNDGGPQPLSEPESQALANYYIANKPRLAITEHSHGGIVEANDAGDSIALGQEYAKLADYTATPTYEIGNFFDYTTTGAFEDWANDSYNLPVLEVELQSATNDEYSRNLPALWAMAEVTQ